MLQICSNFCDFAVVYSTKINGNFLSEPAINLHVRKRTFVSWLYFISLLRSKVPLGFAKFKMLYLITTEKE